MWAPRKSPPCVRALGDAWYGAGEFRKAADAFTAARALVASDPFVDAELLLKLSHVEAKLGKYELAKQWAEQGRTTLQGLDGAEAAREAVRAGAWYAIVLQCEGRTADALERAEQTVAEAADVDDPEALADAYFVMGWAYGELGKEGGLTTCSARWRPTSARAISPGRRTCCRPSAYCASGKVTGTRPCPITSGAATRV